MPGFVALEIEGVERAQRALAGLKGDLRAKALRAGIVQASRPVKARMSELAPWMEGYLSGSIGHATLSASATTRAIGSGFGKATVAVLVGVTRRAPAGVKVGRKAIWHEYGTVKMGATPFLSEGFDQASSQFENLFFAGIDRYIKRRFKD